MQKIINVISGKGGTGKTLLTAVIAELLSNKGYKVLVIDLDVFVRGLTTLLYFQKNQTLKIAKEDELTVADFFKFKGEQGYGRKLSICRYRAFDVAPSVPYVNETLIFKDIMPNSVDEAISILNALLNYIPNEYEFVFLDSRAGYDELISATHHVSDFSLCVEEADNISRSTSENLIAQLKKDDLRKQIFRVTNKAREIYNEQDSLGFENIGSIPFDTDVLNSFGTKNFWNEVGRSLYKDSLVKSWNLLANKMDLDVRLEEKRTGPLGMQKVEKRISMLSTFSRINFIYGIIIVILSFYLMFYESGFYASLMRDPKQLFGVCMSIFGILMIVFSVFHNNRK